MINDIIKNKETYIDFYNNQQNLILKGNCEKICLSISTILEENTAKNFLEVYRKSIFIYSGIDTLQTVLGYYFLQNKEDTNNEIVIDINDTLSL
jgi:hypothetical protein